jgi:hypothetical protein
MGRRPLISAATAATELLGLILIDVSPSPVVAARMSPSSG